MIQHFLAVLCEHGMYLKPKLNKLNDIPSNVLIPVFFQGFLLHVVDYIDMHSLHVISSTNFWRACQPLG